MNRTYRHRVEVSKHLLGLGQQNPLRFDKLLHSWMDRDDVIRLRYRSRRRRIVCIVTIPIVILSRRLALANLSVVRTCRRGILWVFDELRWIKSLKLVEVI